MLGQTAWLGSWPGLNTIVNWPVFLVVLAAGRLSLFFGLLLAVILGGLYQTYSIFSGWLHPLAFAAAGLAAWFIKRRLVASRTSLSLMFSVAAGTVAYYLVLTGGLGLQAIFFNGIFVPVWSVWLAAVIWPVVIHPTLAGLWWMLTRQRRANLHLGPVES